ncbi:hypothetical protein E2C01_031279 [Portunus trituberculatus]|uniref:Uncharacterized protein n=1 Tax=Portunus trituberculatus TaxID=210409 RepID=A0A5B7EXP6_PORTR|nr:hypothetical protein [Portunus trituberculatus]
MFSSLGNYVTLLKCLVLFLVGVQHNSHLLLVLANDIRLNTITILKVWSHQYHQLSSKTLSHPEL